MCDLVMDIRKITAKETLSIRHQVLWPSLPMEKCILAEDNTGQHFGGYVDDALICVASVFSCKNNHRLRKFAVLPDMQGKGCGTEMLKYICEALNHKTVSFLWLDARTTAIPFYQKLEFEQLGDTFYKRDVLYVKMQRALTFSP